MGYRRTLLVRWNHRDRLAALVVAVTVAFLVGTVLVVLAVGAQTAAIANQFDSDVGVASYESPDAAEAAAAPGASVLPVAQVTVNGESTLAVGVPAGRQRFGHRALPLGQAGTRGTITTPGVHVLHGTQGSVRLSVTPRGDAVLAPSWYAVTPATVTELGVTGAIVISAGAETPLVSVLQFFLRGTQQALTAISVAAVGAMLLIGVTVHEITRMTVRARRRTIKVARATGAAPTTILGLFTARAGLLTAVGIAVGYALGVVIPNAAVSLAVTLGVPTSLTIGVPPRAVRLLLPLLGGLLAVGAGSGLLATLPALRHSVARLTDDRRVESRLPAALQPRILSPRTSIPTTATLTAFVTFVILIAAMAGAATPVTTNDAIITDPGAKHPVASQVPAEYAAVLRAKGIDASAEILLFEVERNQPIMTRGVNFSAFASVTDSRLVRGHPPQNQTAAVIGADLARTLGVDVGDALVLGGSTRAAIVRVHIVGVFRAPGYLDDQLLVTLPTARHLAGRRTNQVHLIRADRLPGDEAVSSALTSVGIIGLDTPATVATDGQVAVNVTVWNPAPEQRTASIRVYYDDRTRRVTATVAPHVQKTLSVAFAAGEPGRHVVRAGGLNATVRVLGSDAIRIKTLPTRVPPGSEPVLAVVGPSGNSANASVQVANQSYVTGEDGRVRLRFPTSGPYTVLISDGTTTTRTVTVTRAARRQVNAALTVVPSAPSILVQPTARIRVANPWNRTLTRRVTLTGLGTPWNRTVRLSPGESKTVTVPLDRAPPGEQTVRVTVGNQVLTTTYAVHGDERIASVLARVGRRGETGLSRAITVAFGNLRLLVGTLLALAGLMAMGGTTATFARAVHARRRSLGVRRATGASPLTIVRLVLVDALLLGGMAIGIALVAAITLLWGLSKAGYLTVYGVHLSPVPTPAIAVGAVVSGLALTALGALVATLTTLTTSPSHLLTDMPATPREERDE